MIVWSTLPKLSILISAVWAVSEVLLSRLLHSKSDSSNRLDQSSLRVLWLTIIPSIIVGIYLGSRGIGYVTTGSSIISTCGLALIVIGLAIRWTAILTLKRHFTTDVNIQHDHQIVTRGIYGIVRHPAYTGSLLSFLGLGLTFANWLSALVIFVPTLVAFLYRIRVEEAALIGHFGERYLSYCHQVKRLLPWIY